MFNITELRKRFPAIELGNRERSILHEKGAKVKRTETLGVFKVVGKENFFEFTYNRPNERNFKVVG